MSDTQQLSSNIASRRLPYVILWVRPEDVPSNGGVADRALVPRERTFTVFAEESFVEVRQRILQEARCLIPTNSKLFDVVNVNTRTGLVAGRYYTKATLGLE